MNSSQSDELDNLIKMNNGELIGDLDSKKLTELGEERINLMRVINTFKSYADVSKQKLLAKLEYFESLPLNHQVNFCFVFLFLFRWTFSKSIDAFK